MTEPEEKSMTSSKIDVRKGMPAVQIDRAEFSRRYRARFYDPAFDALGAEIARLEEAAWDAYEKYRKTPRTQPAGAGFADPAYEVAIEWLETRRAIHEAEKRQKDPKSPSRILMVNASARSDQTCPGEISKTYRLATLARDAVTKMPGFEVDFLDLSALTAERGRVIYPCKACVSTAQPLCHWPCSCYPNHALGQTGDWMAELYPRWAAAHGVMIVTPVNWYQAPSVLKLMIDRLVCADGGNPDQTSTHGKDPARAKAIELAGWPYPKHLAGRVFSVVVHGDAAGVENLRRILVDWLTDIGLIQAARRAVVGAYLGYYQPYATSHADLDADTDFQAETVNAALALAEAVKLNRTGALKQPDAKLHDAREK
jgi:multimeric flavodoxin WrbA